VQCPFSLVCDLQCRRSRRGARFKAARYANPVANCAAIGRSLACSSIAVNQCLAATAPRNLQHSRHTAKSPSRAALLSHHLPPRFRAWRFSAAGRLSALKFCDTGGRKPAQLQT
jgi:hypothetical protein